MAENGSSRESNGFEQGLQTLLSRAYSPPTFREEFKSGLLEELKGRQKAMAGRRQRNRTLLYIGSFVSAAAAMFIVVLSPALTGPDLPTPTTNNNTAVIASSVKKVPSVEPAAATALSPSENNPVTEAVAVKTPVALEPGDVMVAAVDPVEYSTDQGKNWKQVAVGENFAFARNAMMRMPLGQSKLTGLHIGDGITVILKNGAVVCNDNGKLKLESGSLFVSSKAGSPNLGVALPEYDLNIEPESEVLLKMKKSDNFAANGSPVPQVVVLAGKAKTLSGSTAATLLAGNTYDMYRTPTGVPPGRGFQQDVRNTFFNDNIDTGSRFDVVPVKVEW